MVDRDRLSRPRLVSLWQRVTPGATVLVTAQHRSGVASSVREWLSASDRRLVHWSSNRVDVPADAPDADVVLLDLEGMLGTHVDATKAVRERWPHATLIAVTSTSWPPGLLDEGIRTERVFSGALFGFTADEVLDRAEQLDLHITWDEATDLLDRVGTHAGFVDAVLRAAAARGSLDDRAVRVGCDDAAAQFASDAAAGVFRPNGWTAVLISARIGPMPRRTLLNVWGRDEVVRAALDNIMQAGFFTEDLDTDTVELRPAVREALQRRIEREMQIDAVDEAVAELASGLLGQGRTHDGWEIVAQVPGARARTLAHHWWQLSELDVDRARPWLQEAVQREGAPELRVALARTLIDVTSANHSGQVPPEARRQARQLLDEADAAGSPRDGQQIVVDTLRGVLLRLDGHYRDALHAHEALADAAACTAAEGLPSDAPGRTHVHAWVLVHAALSAFDAAHLGIASARLNAAAALAHSARHSRLASYAHDIHLAIAPEDEPIAMTYQGLVDNIIGAHVIARPMKSIAATWAALYVADPAAIRAALDDVDAASFDDPLALRLISAVTRSIAHGILETSTFAIRSLEMFEQDLAGRELSPVHQALLTWAHTEALIRVGAADSAVAMLEGSPAEARRVIPVDILLARAHLQSGSPERAIAVLANASSAHASGVLGIWAHVLLFLAYRGIGSDDSHEIARQHLSTAIVASSRARPVMPFVLQGMPELNTTIAQAEQLTLDPAGRRLVNDLVRVRDDLQFATGATLSLSERERAVIAQLVHAESTKNLAQRLHVSPNTVKTQLRSIYRKLGVSSWADAVATAKRMGLAE
ncbi:LuxR C-terminal-related transcriptional regulator [Microbacterium sp. G2-8]|uniref:helix-turn-helix transcriptional regulator n=1 Tax=Microbacterium sp. G2-8 TaxID=2842454 RepID=UPI0021AAEB63|nr:LuxR C-terminal-related transcriptional regulator [Microbacterium sp. G2-8]